MLFKKICCFSATCMTIGSSAAVVSYLNKPDTAIVVNEVKQESQKPEDILPNRKFSFWDHGYSDGGALQF